LIFKGKIFVEEFEASDQTQFFYGCDFGYSQDPTCLVRMWTKDKCLFIDYEAYGVGVEIEELPAFFKTVPDLFTHDGLSKWKILADSARPETISYLASKGFCIEGAEKGKGSVEDGIEFLRSFERIVIHPRCKGSIGDFQNYKWKTDRITNNILPIPLDASNHAPDACRYALSEYIKSDVPFVWSIQ
jgi:phage terminase large subunit